MKLSKDARDGLEWAAHEVGRLIVAGNSPNKALKKVWIKNLKDTYFFLEYLRETKRYALFKRLTK